MILCLGVMTILRTVFKVHRVNKLENHCCEDSKLLTKLSVFQSPLKVYIEKQSQTVTVCS